MRTPSNSWFFFIIYKTIVHSIVVFRLQSAMLNMPTPLFLAADVEALRTEFALNIVVFTLASARI